MKRLFSTLLVLAVTFGAASANVAAEPEFHFKHFLQLMNYGAKGKTLEEYRSYAREQKLNLIFHEEEPMEIYFVWAQDVTYKKWDLSQGNVWGTYTKTGNNPRCVNMDLTVNGKNKFSPITITIVFPDAAAQKRFYDEGIKLGCIVNDALESTDIDPTWSNVSGIKYCIDAKRLTSWRFMFFYEKDGLHMCTFLF